MNKMHITEAKQAGYIIDTCCNPPIAYKGERSQPEKWHECYTELESKLLAQRQNDIVSCRLMIEQEMKRTAQLLEMRETNATLAAQVQHLTAALIAIAEHSKPQMGADPKSIVGQVKTGYDYQFYARDQLAMVPK